MKTHSSSLLAALVLLALALTAFPVLAQSASPVLATWDTQVWPEYDQPSVLVIVSGSFVPDTPFPQQVRVPIPAGARVHAVAYPEANGNLLSLAWTSEPGANGQTVVFDLDQPSFVVEYYADILTPPPSRSFALPLVAPYAAQQASLALRQPSRSSDLQTTPAMVPGGMDALGNPSFTLDLGALVAGQNTPLQVSYTKADAQPSVSSAPAAPIAAESGSASSWWPWVAGLAAAVIAGAITFYLVQRRRSTAASRQSRRRSARKQGAQPVSQTAGGAQAAPAASSTKFCVQCGQKFEGSDKFCRKCGAPRR
ncbi:MAG TPA: zinc ribbon domain-containing protein [Anaerolineae bacterium]|nr:zinc ribbon domain-containing protein [Anaerolineae bacterium]